MWEECVARKSCYGRDREEGTLVRDVPRCASWHYRTSTRDVRSSICYSIGPLCRHGKRAAVAGEGACLGYVRQHVCR